MRLLWYQTSCAKILEQGEGVARCSFPLEARSSFLTHLLPCSRIFWTLFNFFFLAALDPTVSKAVELLQALYSEQVRQDIQKMLEGHKDDLNPNQYPNASIIFSASTDTPMHDDGLSDDSVD